ncbi:IS1182 family transposase [Methanobrevibacter sp. DSM 116169]|uniref:IS1182 family transposase n=1 Tax=Methanobrevibacter sp. DSM 116169 TaxID=3242727 RepID=UPI0038FD3820
MVLKDDTINQQFLVPMDLRDLIPNDHPCYLVQNVVDRMDFTDVDDKYRFNPGAHAYSRKMLLRLVLMGSFDGGLSGRELERRSRTDVSYMYLAGLQRPDFRTLNRFKVEEKELINVAFQKSILIAKEEGLVKINHIAIDGTKIKAKASINNITDEEQLKMLKNILNDSIELDEEEDKLLGDDSGNSIPKSLIDKESFDKISEKIENETSESKNQEKLKSSSKKLLKQAFKSKKDREKVLNKIEKLEKELEKTNQKTISLNDPESRWMLNKKNKWEFDYNLQIGVDEYKGIMLSIELTNNPTDVHELIPQIEQIKENIGPLDENTQISADNGYSTDENIEYLEEEKLDGYISTRKLSRKLKNNKNNNNPYSKDNFTFNLKKDAYICPEGKILNQKGIYENPSKTVYWTNECKNCKLKEKCVKNGYRRITDYGNSSKIRMLRKMEEEWAQKIYKKRSKTVEWPFGNIKRNLRINEFNTIGTGRTNTEAKLLGISHNLKRIHNEKNKNN